MRMMILFLILIVSNTVAEYLLNKMLIEQNILEKKNRRYHTVCSVMSLVWFVIVAYFLLPLPVLLIGLLVLQILDIRPYRNCSLILTNFTVIFYVLYCTILMTVLNALGVFASYIENIWSHGIIYVGVLNITFLIFNIICSLLLHFHPSFLWREDYERSKVQLYTRFLMVCALYHIIDAIILTLYHEGRLSYMLMLGGDVLIFFLIFNLLKYNFEFAKGEEARDIYAKSQILVAQQFFEKQSLKKMSEIDVLTNAYNRREIELLMKENIQKNNSLICVFIDLDGLKRTNDEYGHEQGDFMLKRFAEESAKMLQDKGYLARIGGDEFLLVFLDEKVEDVERQMKELQLKLLASVNEKDKISFSYGISFGEDSVEQYILHSDQRMYEDKDRKRRGPI